MQLLCELSQTGIRSLGTGVGSMNYVCVPGVLSREFGSPYPHLNLPLMQRQSPKTSLPTAFATTFPPQALPFMLAERLLDLPICSHGK